ncbi:MAG: hypothetical protein ACRDM0_11545 [Thermoleophilaceae bacterium]
MQPSERRQKPSELTTHPFDLGTQRSGESRVLLHVRAAPSLSRHAAIPKDPDGGLRQVALRLRTEQQDAGDSRASDVPSRREQASRLQDPIDCRRSATKKAPYVAVDETVIEVRPACLHEQLSVEDRLTFVEVQLAGGGNAEASILIADA